MLWVVKFEIYLGMNLGKNEGLINVLVIYSYIILVFWLFF